MITNKPYGSTGSNLADQAGQSAENGLRAAQRTANDVLGHLSESVSDLQSKASPMLNRVTSQAETMARQSMDAMRDSTAQMRERALRASDQTVGYIKDEPVKSMLIAAATGAALMALLGMMGRNNR
jgi:ElaB/YqjD/DUF883 family membrane-anchored ribosome-binding protein